MSKIVCTLACFLFVGCAAAHKTVPNGSYSANMARVVEGMSFMVSDQTPQHIVVPRTTNLEDVYVAKPVLSYVKSYSEETGSGEQE